MRYIIYLKMNIALLFGIGLQLDKCQLYSKSDDISLTLQGMDASESILFNVSYERAHKKVE